MCLKLITQLLIQSFVVQIIIAEEIKMENNNQLNTTTFLPYTLKTKLIRDKENGNVQNFDILNADEVNKYEILDTKKFEYKENIDYNPELQQPETSNWKRLTTYLSPYTTLQKQQHSGGSYGEHYDYMYNTPTNLYKQQHHSFQSSSLIGSSNFLLMHIVFFILHLVGLSHILFGIVALLNRILYFGSPLQPTNDGFGSGNFYKK